MPFIPTAKNWKFVIGRGVQFNKEGDLIKDYWRCRAFQYSNDGKILTVKTIEGGNTESMSVHKGN